MDTSGASGNRFEQLRSDSRGAQGLVQVASQQHLVAGRIGGVDLDQAREVSDDLIAETIPAGLG